MSGILEYNQNDIILKQSPSHNQREAPPTVGIHTNKQNSNVIIQYFHVSLVIIAYNTWLKSLLQFASNHYARLIIYNFESFLYWDRPMAIGADNFDYPLTNDSFSLLFLPIFVPLYFFM